MKKINIHDWQHKQRLLKEQACENRAKDLADDYSVQELKNIISTPLTEVSGQIIEMLTEKLCKKGKAYVAKRKAAGEKHGAYLMGRAVKVCKGQMKSEAEYGKYFGGRTKGEEMSINIDIEDDIATLKGASGEILHYLKVDQNKYDNLKDRIDTEFDGNMEDFLEEFAMDFLSPNIEKINKYYGANLSKYGVGELITDFYEADGLDFISSNEKFEFWLNRNREFYLDESLVLELKNIIRQTLEEKKKGKCKPSKGKRFAKRVDGKCRSFGQAGKAKKGGDRIRPGTAKGHAYCARSAKIKKCKNPPCANALSRKKWKCQGSRSVAEAKWTD